MSSLMNFREQQESPEQQDVRLEIRFLASFDAHPSRQRGITNRVQRAIRLQLADEYRDGALSFPSPVEAEIITLPATANEWEYNSNDQFGL